MQITEWQRRVAVSFAQMGPAMPLAPVLQPFRVRIGKPNAPRLEFGCMATDSASVITEYLELADRHERVEAFPVRAGEPFPVKVARHELAEVQLRGTARQAVDPQPGELGESCGPDCTFPDCDCKPESPTEYAQRRARQNDQRAMALQIAGMATGEVR